MVGFTGSRFISKEVATQVSQLSATLSLQGHTIAVGCASGTDAAVRAAVPQARVFLASGRKPWQLAQRSQAMVQGVVQSGGFRAIVGFPSQPCPAGLVPSSRASNCFSGHGSGTWGTLAYAYGLGLPVFVFWSGQGTVQLPTSWGQGVCSKGQGSLAGAWSPQITTLSLF